MRKDYNLEKRKYVIGGFLVAIVLIYTLRLLQLQVFDTQYKENADTNAFLRKVIYPSRGQIYDRNGRLVVFNQPAYDLMMIPKDVHPFDTVDMCNTLQISVADFKRHLADMRDPQKNRNYSDYSQQTVMQHLTPQVYGRMQEKLYRFPGFFIVQRMIREYNYAAAANVLGDVREVNEADLERDSYYRPGDFTGDLGIEKSYEQYLRGRKGQEILIRDAMGKIKGRYNGGRSDVPPEAGHDLKLSIDIALQEFGEKLMRGKAGAIVAIEPSTGEILALVTSPTYDPSMLVGKDRGKNYRALVSDKQKPLFNRAIMAAYPPGSTFKPTQGLIFRQEQIVNLQTQFPCHHGYINGLKVGCHGHASPISLLPALQTSCNAYFCWGFYYMINKRTKYGNPANAFGLWKDYMVSMGYGYKLGIDLPGESRGFIPNVAYYDKALGKGRWSANSIISVAIGQGEILATPLQIANLGATIANRGYYIPPHIVKYVYGIGAFKKYLQPKRTKIDQMYYNDIVQGMRMAVLGGTCHAANVPGLDICGKTGTAQNPHGRDHSVFMGFAPMNNPKIAICVFVENAGFGATFGVPIGKLMIQRYLQGPDAPGLQGAAEAMAARSTISVTADKSAKTRRQAAYGKRAGGKSGSSAEQEFTITEVKSAESGTKE